MTVPRRVPGAAADRSLLESPWLAAGVAVVVLAVVAILLLPGLLGGQGPGATAPPNGSGGLVASPTPAAPTFLRPTPSPQPSFTSYVVQPGDTLSSIARHFRTTARSIAWWNRTDYPSLDPESEGYNPNGLKVGWRLRILPDSVVDETG
jgi:hypothetical protein